MNPNTYLKSMWRNNFDDTVFVAMSFLERYKPRFEDVIKPAVEGEKIGGRQLKAARVDISSSGESILTEISNGIAHCFLFLADVSTIDRLKFGDKPARNENVLYEVGMALACRSPEEILLVRDDRDPLIFDTSTVPHETLDFDDKEIAITQIRKLLCDRANERQIIRDARVITSMTHLGPNDYRCLRVLGDLGPDHSADLRKEVSGRLILPIPTATALANLLRLDLAVAHSLTDDYVLTYKLTDIGRAVNDRFETLVNDTKNRIDDEQTSNES
jgi:hypothetical protein